MYESIEKHTQQHQKIIHEKIHIFSQVMVDTKLQTQALKIEGSKLKSKKYLPWPSPLALCCQQHHSLKACLEPQKSCEDTLPQV